MGIEEIDRNFRLETVDGHDVVFRPVTEVPFLLTGLPFFAEERVFCRLPQGEIPKMNQGVQGLAWHTSGVMAHFRSDSGTVAIRAMLRAPGDMNNMARSGSSGFDLYIGRGTEKVYRKTAIPGSGQTTYTSVLLQNAGAELRDFTLNFPLYNGVKELEIGLTPNAVLEPAVPFAVATPILFYGSSITQGGCASRPGNAYTHIVGRRLNVPIINYGFSGSARGEQEMAALIGRIPMSVFVYDYDHNAPTIEHLQATHEPFFRAFRDARPETPVVFVSRCDFDGDRAGSRARRDIIRNTYENARAAGDEKVFFVDGETLFGKSDRDACTVDGCHPNDLGFIRMAEAITPAVAKALALA